MRRDVALLQVQLEDVHIERARTAPFHGNNFVGPNAAAFDEKIFAMRDQHALHRGMTSHFKIPKKPALKTASQSKSSVHQRLGPQVTQGTQSFRKGQQQKKKAGFFSGNSSTTGGNSNSVQSRRGRFNTANKKKAGSSGGTRQWRQVGGGLSSWFWRPVVKPVGRVQIRPDSAVGSSITVVGSISPTHKNSHQFSHEKQKTGSSEGSRFSAAERGYRTRLQQPLLGVLQFYDPASDPNVRMLLLGLRLARPVTRRTMPQWDLHLVLSALMGPPFASPRARPTNANIELKWRTLKMRILLAMAAAWRRSFIHALSVAPAHITFGWGDVDGQSTVSLLLEPGFLAKNQLPSQVLRWATIPGIDHLHPDDFHLTE